MVKNATNNWRAMDIFNFQFLRELKNIETPEVMAEDKRPHQAPSTKW